ncbi:hypothetical protein CTAYLR_008373 [Chrysophaeum taylorii]|uniref:J domain-containing protein n=1 Tax=Chrysophaeum taylorii TaxID=2483200 RepID=A0AAD7XNP7_9STRA|nr:hypothetical protein CTAYLR_008373 [Chrysophaeum taylorii]
MSNDFEELLSRLTVGAPKLGKDEIIRLQKTLAEACRVHDPVHADEMAGLLAKMDVRDDAPAVKFNFTAPPTDRDVFKFTSPGREATSPESFRVSTPRGSALDDDDDATAANGGKKSADFGKPVRTTFLSQRRHPAPMSVDEEGFKFVAPLGQFQVGVAPNNNNHNNNNNNNNARRSRLARGGFKPAVARRLEPSFSRTANDDPPTVSFEMPAKPAPAPPVAPMTFNVGAPPPPPPPPPPRKSRPPTQQHSSSPLKSLQFKFGAVELSDDDATQPSSSKENNPPPSAASDEPLAAEPGGFCLGSTSGDKKKTRAKRDGLSRRGSSSSPRVVVETRQPSWDGDYERAKQLYDKGDYSSAAEAFSGALDAAPSGWMLGAKALGNRGACYVMLGRHDDALRDCRAATRRDPSLYKAHNRVGRLELADGQLDAAAESFAAARRWALEKGEDRDAAAARATADSGLADVDRVRTALERAKAALDRAAKHVKHLDTDDSGLLSPQARRQRARNDSLRAAARTECERGLRAADDALARAPRNQRAMLAKARALARLERWPDLEAACAGFAQRLGDQEKARLDSPVSIAVRLVRASPRRGEQRKRHDYDDDDDDEEENRGDDVATLAELYVKSLRRREAPDSIARSSADDALSAVAGCDRAAATCRERCRAQLQRAAKLRRAKDRADSAYTRGHFRAAIAMYRDALRLDYENENDALRATLHCNLAAAALVLDRAADAVDHCTHALKLRPDYLRARLRRARARARLDQPASSLADFDAYLSDVAKAADDKLFNGDDSIDRVKQERRKVELELRRKQHQHAAAPAPSSGHQPRSSASSARTQKPTAAVLSSTNHYGILGLTSDAQIAEIKRAYARLALQYHPDRNDSPGATAAMARINEAYECLKDPSLRAT